MKFMWVNITLLLTPEVVDEYRSVVVLPASRCSSTMLIQGGVAGHEDPNMRSATESMIMEKLVVASGGCFVVCGGDGGWRCRCEEEISATKSIIIEKLVTKI